MGVSGMPLCGWLCHNKAWGPWESGGAGQQQLGSSRYTHKQYLCTSASSTYSHSIQGSGQLSISLPLSCRSMYCSPGTLCVITAVWSLAWLVL